MKLRLKTLIVTSVMPYHTTSGRELPQSALWTGEVFTHPDDLTMAPLPETDLTKLAAKFAVPGGPGLAPDLAMELALQMVLHEIVGEACASTSATGAAIALYREGELVCQASHGLTTPPLGSRLDVEVGLSGVCLRTGRIQLCNDVQTDLRADFEACSRMGVHSVVVLPLLRDGEIVGIFEVLSSRRSAFGNGDINRLEALAHRVLKNLEQAAQPPVPQEIEIKRASAGPDRVADLQGAEAGQVEVVRRWTDIVTWALAIVVLFCGVWLSMRIIHRFAWQRTAQRPPAAVRPSAPLVSAPANAAIGNDSAATESEGGARKPAKPASPVSSPPVRDGTEVSHSKRNAPSEATEGTLLVFDKGGREVFRMPPSLGGDAPIPAETGVVQASSVQPEVLELSASAAESDLIYRVEPEYPEEARVAGIQGSVLLEVHIRPDGTVKQVKTVSGEPVLANAAMTAVKQWRFKPREVNGQPAAMQTTISLNFRLPS